MAHAEPETCPRQCDRSPGGLDGPVGIPLNPAYAWPVLARSGGDRPSRRGSGFEEECGSPPVPDRGVRGGERARWSAGRAVALQAQIVHWRGETWRGGELAHAVFGSAVAALRSCQDTARSPRSLTTAEPDRIAAVISGPVDGAPLSAGRPRTAAPSASSSSPRRRGAPPPQPWPAVPDAQVLDGCRCTAARGPPRPCRAC